MTQWINELINELMNDEASYRTAPATPGLLIKPIKKTKKSNSFQNAPKILKSWKPIVFLFNNLIIFMLICRPRVAWLFSLA